MGKGANDVPGFTGLALSSEFAANGLDQVGGQVGDVAQRLVFDLSALAVGTPEQVGLVGLPFIYPAGGGYMYWTVSGRYTFVLASFGSRSRAASVF